MKKKETQKTMDDYINFFKDKPSKTKRTDEFIKEYQQKKGRYIAFAESIIQEQAVGLIPEQKNYFNWLMELKNDKEKATKEIAERLGVDEEIVKELNPLGIEPDRDHAEPNQKWHLFISWFGWKKYVKEEPGIAQSTCPELWLWMCEVSGIFSEEELDELFDCAKNYREAQDKYNDAKKTWNAVKKKFQEALENKMV